MFPGNILKIHCYGNVHSRVKWGRIICKEVIRLCCDLGRLRSQRSASFLLIKVIGWVIGKHCFVWRASRWTFYVKEMRASFTRWSLINWQIDSARCFFFFKIRLSASHGEQVVRAQRCCWEPLPNWKSFQTTGSSPAVVALGGGATCLPQEDFLDAISQAVFFLFFLYHSVSCDRWSSIVLLYIVCVTGSERGGTGLIWIRYTCIWTRAACQAVLHTELL